jgi:hypothetical protein
MKLICKETSKIENKKILANYTHTIVFIRNKKEFTIKDKFSDINMIFPIKYLYLHFKLPFCQTVFSVQGSNIDVPMAIFDTNACYIDRRFIWTAITRATKLNNITIFLHSEKKLKEYKIRQYFDSKISAY